MPNNKIKFRYGICQNSHMEETGKPCPLCLSKEIQRVIASKELVCSECKAKLKEIPRPASFWEKYGKLIMAAIAIIIIGGGGTAIFLSGGENKSKDPLTVSLNHIQKSLKVGECDTLVVVLTPEDPNASIIWQVGKGNIVTVNNGIVEAIEEGSDSITAQVILNGETASVSCSYSVEKAVIEEPQQQPEEPVTTTDPHVTEPTPPVPPNPPASPTTGTLKLSYGTYTGQIKNGYPNGQGRLVYNKSRQISKYDSKGRTAQAGESVQGNFKNGFLTIGKHYDASGNLIESLNIGSPVEGVFESK